MCGWVDPPSRRGPGLEARVWISAQAPQSFLDGLFFGGRGPPGSQAGWGIPSLPPEKKPDSDFLSFFGTSQVQPGSRVRCKQGVLEEGGCLSGTGGGGGSGPRGLGMGHLGPPHKERCFPSGALPPSKHANMATFPKIGFFKHFCVMIASLPLSFCQLLKKKCWLAGIPGVGGPAEKEDTLVHVCPQKMYLLVGLDILMVTRINVL